MNRRVKMHSHWRLLKNAPVLRFVAAFVLASALLTVPALMASSFAAENNMGGSGPALPADLSPEQAEMARKYLESHPEESRALEAAQQRKEQEALEGVMPGDENADEGRKGLAPGAEGAAAAARADRFATTRYDWRKSPYVSRLFGSRLNDEEKRQLVHFGHDLFAPRTDVAVVLENAPAVPGYVIGPGDEIVVRMWGRMEGTQRLTVDRDGKIFFPKLGSFYVAGKTFEELKSFLQGKVSGIKEARSDVSLGRMKGVRVSVIGEVHAPGWYDVSSLHTALQALSLASGVKDIGSLRRIELRRGGKAVETIDLYDFLLKGDGRSDLRLLQGDTIFVPVVGKLVVIAGEVRRPAIYELRDEKPLLDLVRVAGGFAPSAWKQRVLVERLEGNVSRVVLDAIVEDLEKGKATVDLSDGDIVRVFPILPVDINVVTLEGNVHRPGKYELKPGMTVGSLLKDAMDFLPETYFDYALLTRLVPPDLHKEVIPVNLREIVLERKPEADVALQGRDKLTVYNRSSFRDLPKATISGEVRLTRQPPVQPPKAEGFLPAGQGPEKPPGTEGPFPAGSGRERPLRTEGSFPAGSGREGPLKTEGSFAPVPGLEPSPRAEGQVTTGKVALGMKSEKDFLLSKLAAESRVDNIVLTIEIQAGMRVADLVRMAGGLTRLANLERAEVVRVDENRTYRTIYFHLGKAIAGDPEENLLLSNEDHVQIHSIMETRFKKTVLASGEVNNAGEYVLTDGMRLSDLLFKAGGFREGAYTKEAEVIRREISPRGDLVRTQALVVLPEKALRGEADADIPLKEYDLLVVRQIPNWTKNIRVTLAGEVQFPGIYTAHKGERLSSVVERAGGFTNGAYLKAAQFTRLSTQRTQQEAIDKLIDDLEVEVAQKAQQVSGAIDKEDLEANKQLLEARRSLIAQLKKARAKGRVVIHLTSADRLKGSAADILLEDGDRLEIPEKTNVVNVVGRVYNPTGVVYNPADDTVGHYLKMVGGPTASADRDHIFLLKSNGSVVTRENADGAFLSTGRQGLLTTRVDPGDSIVVPEKLLETRLMKDVKDITQILYQIAVMSGIVILAF
jgi:protein involved in polysaccharide export with SLBB domain